MNCFGIYFLENYKVDNQNFIDYKNTTLMFKAFIQFNPKY